MSDSNHHRNEVHCSDHGDEMICDDSSGEAVRNDLHHPISRCHRGYHDVPVIEST